MNSRRPPLPRPPVPAILHTIMTPRKFHVLALILASFAASSSMATDGPAIVKPAKPAKASKPRKTWSQLIEAVQQQGVEKTLKFPLPQNLGFATDTLKAKGLRVSGKSSSDHYSHEIFATEESVVIGRSRTEVRDGQTYVEGFFVRFDLKGVALSAVNSHGIAHQVDQSKADIASTEIKTWIERDRAFLLDALNSGILTNK